MKKTTLVILNAIVLSSVLYNTMVDQNKPENIPSEVVEKFTKWKSSQNKIYTTPEELEYRLKVFYMNHQKVELQQSRTTSYRLGLNKFADLTVKEFKAKYLGYRPMTNIETDEDFDEEKINDVPDSWDWEEKGAVTNVKNQMQCGGCWAFSAAGALEGLQYLSTKALNSLSPQYLIDCSKNGNQGCNGGLEENAFEYTKFHGIPSDANYPYVGKDEKCRTPKVDYFHNKAWRMNKPHKALNFKLSIYQRPTSLGIAAEDIMLYESGVFDNMKCGRDQELDHSVLAVGYGKDSTTKVPFWRIKNSWGEDWGEKGYIRFERDMKLKVNVCGILIDSSYPY